MTQPAIKVEQLWKEYVIGRSVERHETFYSLLSAAVKTPFRRMRELGRGGNEADRFWALRDVSFEIPTGEVVGIVGRNGAGKSTLLKTLSRITAPTRGTVTIAGRLASLLEVGTGFHPELTGRENIFLNGAILGMTRREVASRFDEIVAFAEIERFIDTPVKRYSSGMYVRLAFAVAAHIEADVLLVDEVLAVGDAAFQRKSIGRMGDVAKGGKTVFLVSHNLAAIRSLCDRVLVFERGCLSFDGGTSQGLFLYERGSSEPDGALDSRSFQGPLSEQLRFDQLVYKQADIVVQVVDPLRDVEIELRGCSHRAFSRLNLNVKLYREGVYLGACHDAERDEPMEVGEFVSAFHIPGGVLRTGRYTLGIGASGSTGDWIWGGDVAVLDVSGIAGDTSGDRRSGVIAIPHTATRVHGMRSGASSDSEPLTAAGSVAAP